MEPLARVWDRGRVRIYAGMLSWRRRDLESGRFLTWLAGAATEFFSMRATQHPEDKTILNRWQGQLWQGNGHPQ
jgi:hypothetical protein